MEEKFQLSLIKSYSDINNYKIIELLKERFGCEVVIFQFFKVNFYDYN